MGLSCLAQRTYADAFGDSMPADELAAHLNDNLSEAAFGQMLLISRVLVAEEGGKMIGFVQIGTANYPEVGTGPEDGAVHRMYVSREFQNLGLGRELIERGLQELSNGRVFLDVWEKNLGAIRFYERVGFRVVGERRFVFPSGALGDLDLIMMRD